MERLYAELSEYYVFDKLKYTLEEFFGDIKTFKDQFKQVGLVFEVILKSIPVIQSFILTRPTSLC